LFCLKVIKKIASDILEGSTCLHNLFWLLQTTGKMIFIPSSLHTVPYLLCFDKMNTFFFSKTQ